MASIKIENAFGNPYLIKEKKTSSDFNAINYIIWALLCEKHNFSSCTTYKGVDLLVFLCSLITTHKIKLSARRS